jgi:HAMP domain-containing protein
MTDTAKSAGGFRERNPGPFQRWLNQRSLQEALLLGIFVPILIAFLIITVLLFVNVGPLVSIRALGSDSLKQLGAASVKESVASLNKMGEKIIQEKAEGVARQIEIYLEAHPGLSEAALAGKPRLQEIAIQRVGETGYTAVHNNRGINIFHVNPKIVGTNLHNLTGKLPEFVKVMKEGLKTASGGYYQWTDVDGKVRPKYMFSAPVEGTNLIVAATTYIDEFGKPARVIQATVDQMQAQYAARYAGRFLVFLAVVLIVLAVLIAVIYAFSSAIVRPIRRLSEAADRISMGDLEAPINVEGEGEVARLAQSIERMRTSVQTALERLEKRRPITIRQ